MRIVIATVGLALAAVLGSAQAPQGRRTVATVADERLVEISGMALARADGQLWVHNDSGDGPNLYVINLRGRLVAMVRLQGAQAIDWEDMARAEIATGGGAVTARLYAGDIGDNYAVRPQVRVYRLDEPEVPELRDRPVVLDVVAEAFDLVYPDGAHDAETLLVETPAQGGGGERIIILSKRASPNHVYHAVLPERPAGPIRLVDAGPIRGIADPMITGGDVDRTGQRVVVRTYAQAFEWDVADGDIVHALVGRDPARTCALPDQPQGEAICYDREDTGFFTISEAAEGPTPLYWVPR